MKYNIIEENEHPVKKKKIRDEFISYMKSSLLMKTR